MTTGGPSVLTALAGRCPRCGKGQIYGGFLKLAPTCPECGLDLARLDQGDGPAVFVILIAGFLVCGLALWTEMTFSPPYWVHIVLWLPLTLIVTLGLLRPLKSLLVLQHFRMSASEGRVE